MNIREELLKEKVFTKEQCIKIANFALASDEGVKEVMAFFTGNEYRLAQRSAWIISVIVTVNPSLIKPYIKHLVKQLKRKNVHDAVIRNSVSILQQIKIPESLHGELMNNCFELLAEPLTPVAIKAFSLTALYNLSNIYPEIKNELKLIIEERCNYETAAFKSRSKKILKEMESGIKIH